MKSSGATNRILLVEDNPDIVEIIEYNLRREGFEISVARDGEEGIRNALQLIPDLILLDLMLPKMDGFEVCRSLRQRSETKDIPIIMLTARGGENDVVTGLQRGADDYVTKPFSSRELLARIQAVLRRSRVKDSGNIDIVEIRGLKIDSKRHEVTLNGNVLKLTLAEFKLLKAMAAAPGRVFTRDQLVEKIGGEDISIIDRNVDVHISALRRKLGEYGSMIATIRGVGYRFGD